MISQLFLFSTSFDFSELLNFTKKKINKIKKNKEDNEETKYKWKICQLASTLKQRKIHRRIYLKKKKQY